MWSEMDSPLFVTSDVSFSSLYVHASHGIYGFPYLLIPNRRHPSRLFVFNRSRTWKKGIGELDPVTGGSG